MKDARLIEALQKHIDTQQRTPPRECPHCHKVHDALSTDREMKPGIIVICADCGELSILTEELTQRDLTPDEYIAIAHEPEINFLRKVWKEKNRK